MTLAERILADLETETRNTRRLLEIVPEDRLTWKPHEKSMTLGQLCGHIAETPRWAPALVEAEMDFGDMGDYQPLVANSRKELIEAMDRNLAMLREAFTGRDDAFMMGTWTGRKGDQILMQGPRHQVLRQIAIHHWIHHRGQLTVYLRLCNVPLPPTYGPTADTQEWS